ncbi:MAG TPA: TolC family protein [Gemmatimonadales bacterium]|jgi:outer membrane protein TolC|nr:TolC family protein [Gemmatimonadales bacterium]
MRILLSVLLLSSPWAAQVETPAVPPAGVTIEEAVHVALQNYPAIKAAMEGAAAAQAGVKLSRTSYLPRADFLWQSNRATRNNIFGLLLPQPIVAGISGPVGFNDGDTAWGSATGMMLNWEPFDFGLRKASVQSAEATAGRAEAGVEVSRLQVATATADAFLSVVATEQSRRAARAAVERGRIFFDVVSARVQAGLRPGADAERARAELAVAESQLARAEEAVTAARIVLSQYSGLPRDITVREGSLLQRPAPPAAAAQDVAQHPLAQEQRAAVDEAQARWRVLDRSYFPRFNLLADTYARGTGARTNGTTLGGFGGLGPTVKNWAVGLNITFPAFDRSAIAARQETELHRQLAETARYDRLSKELTAQFDRAQATLESARRVAQNTPIQLQAARAVEQQATARYRSGLAIIVEVADAQRLLTQAEIDDALARLNVWRGLLAIAVAQGDLEPFLLQTH